MKAFYKELPDNYEMVFKVDANGKKTILLLTLGNLLITAVFLALVIALPFIYTPASATPRLAPDIYLFMFAILLILYIIPLYSHHILLLLKFVNFYHQMRFELLRLYLIHVYVQIYFLANIFELYLLYLLN